MNRALTRGDGIVFLTLNLAALWLSELRGFSVMGGIPYLECFLGANAIAIVWILNRHHWRMKKPEGAETTSGSIVRDQSGSDGK